MKKKSLLILSLLSSVAAISLSSCSVLETVKGWFDKNPSSSETTDTDSSSGTDSTDTSTPEPEKYRVAVTVPSGVSYTLSTDYAAAGEEVTLKITSVGAGIAIKTVTLNNKALTGKNNNTEYTFTMPDQTARIVISLSISGDVVLEGDIVAALTKDPVTGIYAAKGVKAASAGRTSKFNYVIKSGSGRTVLQTLDLDETRSFGNIEVCRDKEYELEVSNGFTYDFYYNPNASETPCYIQRSGVDVLPSDVNSLQDLLITNRTVRSEYAVYPENLVGAHYKVSDKTSNDVITKEMDYKLYENNVSFTKVEDTFDPDNVDPMYVYKSYDATNNLYTVVDTYKKYEGSKLSNDDYYRLSYNANFAHSARFQVVQGDDYGNRYIINERHASRNVRTFAHMPNYFLERDMMYAYRVGFSSDNGMATYDISIVSTETSTGFDVALNSMTEFTKNAGASKDYAYKYTVNMSFNTAGAMTSVSFKQASFNDKEWDYSSHAPKTGVKGTVIKSIVATYTYGDVYTGKPNMGEFNPDNYFVQSLDNVQFFNPKSNDQAALDAGKSVVGLNDDIYLMDSDGEYSPLVTNKHCFSPSTALDLWQYSVTASDNESVIKKEPNDLYNTVSAVATGEANVTITNSVPGTGVVHTMPIKVIPTSKVRDFWMSAIDTECLAVSATVKAGGVYSFNIHAFPKDSELLYTAVSLDESLLKITSAPNSPVLTIDTRGAAGISANTDVGVRIDADYQSYEFGGETITYSPTKFIFTLLPADVDPTGRWVAVDPAMPDTYVNFTTEVYNSTTGTYKGVISDTYLGNTDRFYFEYSFKNGNISAKLYDVDITTFSGTYTAKDFYLDFSYLPSKDYYLVFLAAFEYDADYEAYYYSCILGDLGTDGELSGTDISNARYAPFRRASK